jgi:hypothetical protein
VRHFKDDSKANIQENKMSLGDGMRLRAARSAEGTELDGPVFILAFCQSKNRIPQTDPGKIFIAPQSIICCAALLLRHRVHLHGPWISRLQVSIG